MLDAPTSPMSDSPESAGASAARGDIALLGLVAYSALSAFDHLAQGSSEADDLSDTLLLARLAASRLDHMQMVENTLAGLGVDLVVAMEPFRRPIDEFHRATVPTQWAEALLKIHLAQGLAGDFADLTSEHLTPGQRDLLNRAVSAGELDHEVEQRLVAIVAGSPSDAGRLSLFGRRVLGEALGQAQRVAARNTDLASRLTGTDPGSTDDLARISQMMAELSTRHAQRMDTVGLFG